MKILMDVQTYNEQKFGGISRYHTELYLAYQHTPGVEISCPVIFSDNLHLKEASLFQSFRNVIFESQLLPKFIRKKINKLYKKKNLQATVDSLKAGEFDVFVPTYYNPYFLDKLQGKPFVLTLHDMIHELFPHYFTRDLHTVKNKKLLLEHATRIIAVSENSKKDVLKIYPHIDADKIEVVPLSHSIKTTTMADVDLPENYILFVGNRKDYKNFLFFLRSVAPILKNQPNLFVVAAGGNKFNKEEIQLIKELGVSQQLLQQNFEDHQLATYYSRAKCFVFPSEYEGFGIPILESMACGCPVVLAYHSSFPEVAGEAGVYFQLNNSSDLKEKVQQLLSDENFRQQHIESGLRQAGKFSWEKTAQACLAVYQKAVASQ